MPTPKVSIIMPVYNVERYLRICIESALAQTLEDIELIIMDDGSTDSCPQIIDYYARCDARVRAVHKQNEGYGKSCNRGFDLATGEYVAILESDDFIDPTMYEELYAYAKELDADVVKGPYKDFFSADGISKPYPFNGYLSECMPKGKLYSLIDCPCQLATHQSIWAGIYRRSYMNEHGIRFLEVPGAGNVDVGFCVESLIHSDRLAWLDKPFYNYRVLREGSSTANFDIPLNTSRYQGVHDLLSGHPDIWVAAAPYLVSREAVGLYRYFTTASFTDKDLQNVHGLFADFTPGDIKRAPLISDEVRREVLALHDGTDIPRQCIEARRAAIAKDDARPSGAIGKLRFLIRALDLEGLFRLDVVTLLLMGVLAQALPSAFVMAMLTLLGILALGLTTLLVLLPYKRALHELEG